MYILLFTICYVFKGAIITKFGAWGGRPDATPEMQAPEKVRYNISCIFNQ